jgi:hypothetical protein
MKKVAKVDVTDAIEAVKQAEEKTGVAVKTGLRAGGGTGGTTKPPGGGAVPLYGITT